VTWAEEPPVTCRRCGLRLGTSAALGLKPRTCTTPLVAARTEEEGHTDWHLAYTNVLDVCLARMIERDTETLLRLREPST